MRILQLLTTGVVTTSRILSIRGSSKKSNTLTSLVAMPRKSKEGRNNYSTKQYKPSVAYAYLQVVGSGGEGAPNTVIFMTNYGSYLINCGEGTTRLSAEYRIKLHKSSHVFITYPSWQNVSGLFAMALDVEGSNGTEFLIHGDTDIEKMFYTVNKFIKLRNLKVKVRSCLQSKGYSDGVVSVDYVFLYPSSAKEKNLSVPSLISHSEAKYLGSEGEFNNPFLLKKNEREKHTSSKTDENKGNQLENIQQKRQCMNYAVSYIFKTAGTLGALNLEKCLDYGVPPGPLLGNLKRGEDITLEDGRVVRSVDVKQPDLPGVNVIAIECPSEEYLDSLLEEDSFVEFQSGATPAEAVVHFTSANIVDSEKYQEWINRFPRTTLHLFVNKKNKRTGSVAIHQQQYKFNLLQPEIFPLLNDSGIPEYPRNESVSIEAGHTLVNRDIPASTNLPVYSDKICLKCESNNFISAETLCKVNLIPKENFHYSRMVVLKKEVFHQEMFESEEIKQKIEESIQELRELEEKIKGDTRIYPKIVFLGTGSSKPSKLRNGSGILVYVNSTNCILLDCGEYTYGQMVNMYGVSKAREILRNLQAIYISHMHLDHHMGLVTLLRERKHAFDELDKLIQKESPAEATSHRIGKNFTPTFVFAPIQLLKWLTFFSETFEDISHLYELIPNSDLLFSNRKANPKVNSFKEKLGINSMSTVYVAHCMNAFGISIQHKKKWKITYSGDTKPCQALIDMGMNSDILIHEATLEDAYVAEAAVKLHSTTSQAIDVGKRMKAKYILLTHFSQRYSHLPSIDSSLQTSNIGFAFDFMEVPFNKLPLLSALIKPIQYASMKYHEMIKDTTEMYLLKKEKLRISLKEFEDAAGPPAKVSRTNY